MGEKNTHSYYASRQGPSSISAGCCTPPLWCLKQTVATGPVATSSAAFVPSTGRINDRVSGHSRRAIHPNSPQKKREKKRRSWENVAERAGVVWSVWSVSYMMSDRPLGWTKIMPSSKGAMLWRSKSAEPRTGAGHKGTQARTHPRACFEELQK